MMQNLITTKEAARQLGMTEQGMANWRNKGNSPIPYVKISHRVVRYRQEDIDEFIEQRMVV